MTEERRRAPRYRTRLNATRIDGASERYHPVTDISATGFAYVDWLLDSSPGDQIVMTIGSMRLTGRVVRTTRDGRVGVEIIEVDRDRLDKLLKRLEHQSRDTSPIAIVA
jgi:hypothetical protein